MIHSILVPTDFSANAHKAALYAAELAKLTNASITMLHVLEPVEDRIRQPFPLHARLKDETAEARMEDLQEEQKRIALSYPGIRIETKQEKGAVAESIAYFAEQNGYDLVVMGTRGASGLKEVFMGSVTSSTISRSTTPVMAIPDEYEREEPDAILFASNHFEKKLDILRQVTELASLYNASVHVAVYLEKSDPAEYMEKAANLGHYLEFIRKNFPGVNFIGEILEGNSFEETIEAYESSHEVDILALVPYPKTAWQKLLRKSATRKMAMHSNIPVLALPVRD